MNRKIRHRSLLVLGLLAGCSGESSQGLDSQELTRIEEAGADGECQNGGVVVSSGSDTNKDGKLDEDEVVGEPVVVCSGDTRADPNNPQILTRADALPIGSEQCAAGGVAIHSGVDDDGDALLSDAEIDQTQLVCEHPVLTRAVAIPVGSAECIYGGQRIEAGADDGGGGMGVPDNAVLDEGEVDTSYIQCNASPPVRGEPIAPPAGPAGTAVIDLRGGDTIDALAGAGGTLTTTPQRRTPCIPAVTKMFTTGAADASFTAPTLSLDLGAVPFVVSGAKTLELLNAAPVEGEYYYEIGTSQIVRRVGAENVVVTGLRVEAGATLTLATTQATLGFARDVEISGTVTLSSGARRLNVNARQIQVTATGVLDVAQSAQIDAAGGVSLSTASLLVFQGSLFAQGTATSLGGAFVDFRARGRLVVEGKIDVSGADSTTAAGGAGGSVIVSAELAGVWSAVQIDATGGDGAFGGGAGGSIQLGYDDPNSPIDLRNTGALNASAGAQTGTACAATECLGGTGGRIELLAHLASLTSTGELRADGGNGVSGAGIGGTIEAYVSSFSNVSPDTRLALSGNIHAVGGNASGAGASGAVGGTLAIGNCSGATSVAELLGYTGLEAPGGSASAAGAGGAGGRVVLVSAEDVASPRRLYANVPMSLPGGTGARGGAGGVLQVELSNESNIVRSDLPAELPTLILGGDHSLVGGNATPGASAGGAPGSVRILTRGEAISSGSLTTSGGSGAPSRVPFNGGSIALRSVLGRVLNSAALNANGSDTNVAANGLGNNGGCILLEGQGVTNSAALSAHGGAGGVGGAGGTISLLSYATLGQNTGALDVGGGAGTPVGSAGLAGFDVPSTCF